MRKNSGENKIKRGRINLQNQTFPKHVAIIMDGNGRWAQSKGLPRTEGHRMGVHAVRETIEAAIEFGIKQLTLYCFSSENWKRPQEEIDLLMDLFQYYLVLERENLKNRNIRFEIIGRRDGLSSLVVKEIEKTTQICRNNSGLFLRLAVNYGARTEIVDAVRTIVKITEDPKKREQLLQTTGHKTMEEMIDEDYFSKQMYTAGFDDPDLLIRTANEFRLSNFLLWQIAYTEIWITDVYWPDFTKEIFLQALNDYKNRERRYGGLKEVKKEIGGK